MKKIFAIVLTAAALFSFATAGLAKEVTKAKSGEELFEDKLCCMSSQGKKYCKPDEDPAQKRQGRK